MDTAIREGYEETNGFLGTQQDIKNLFNTNYVTSISSSTYTSFIIEVDYDASLPKKFAELYDDILKNNPKLLLNRDGLYEKDKAKWVSLGELPSFKKDVRVFYRKHISYIMRYFKYIKSDAHVL